MGERLRVLDLFSGIGGFSLGLERTGGFKTVAFCEIEEFPRRVLTKHWPDVPIFPDVRKLKASDVGEVDVICGGFPCQDISTAGKGAGLAGERSGLWREYARLVGEIRPRYVIVENVAALLGRGLGTVLGDLAALGYDAEWNCVPASAVGAPHRRDRLWLVAYPASERQPEAWKHSERSAEWPASSSEILADTESVGPSRPGWSLNASNPAPRTHWEIHRTLNDGGWPAEPDVGRMAYGIPFAVDRLSSLGNAVVPQIPEIIGRAILAAEAV